MYGNIPNFNPSPLGRHYIHSSMLYGILIPNIRVKVQKWPIPCLGLAFLPHLTICTSKGPYPIGNDLWWKILSTDLGAFLRFSLNHHGNSFSSPLRSLPISTSNFTIFQHIFLSFFISCRWWRMENLETLRIPTGCSFDPPFLLFWTYFSFLNEK